MKRIARFTILSTFMISFFLGVVNSFSCEFSPDNLNMANIVPVNAPKWPGK